MASSGKRQGLPPSPPISPALYNKENIECSQEEGLRDPILFERKESGIPEDLPLFVPSSQELVEDAIVSHHIATNDGIFQGKIAKPTREEYKVLLGVSQVMKMFTRDPKAWMRREDDALEAFRAARRRATNPLAAAPRKLAPAPSGVKKQRSGPVAPRIPRVPRAPPKRTPPTVLLDSFDSYRSPVSPPKAPRAPTTRDDSDYQSLPDFSPPLSTLPKGNSNALKADWKGQMLDLSTDPDRDMLHEAEVKLAATLRLSCATYLCSKRRIFIARIEALRIGKEFRKTDAQQACKIDVNKASKLWSAYDKVGWFKPEYFQKYI